MHGTVSQTQPAAARHAARQAKPFAAPPQNVAWHHTTYALKERWEAHDCINRRKQGVLRAGHTTVSTGQHGVLTILEQTVPLFFYARSFFFPSRSTVHRMYSRAGMK